MTRRAFTLIELLVVVSIIALLIAILIPSLSRARQQAKATVCMSNMRGLGVAVHAYAHSNGDRLVTVGLAHGGTADEDATWLRTLRREYGNELLARCPSDKSPYWTEPIPDSESRRRTSYAMSYYTVAEIADRGPYDRLSMFRRPSGTIYIAELADGVGEVPDYAASDHVHPDDWFSDPRRLAEEQVELERHVRRANYTFIDGHAEPYVFEETYSINESESDFGDPIVIVWIHNLWDPAIGR
jgi:prepilin-type N-terminal cleavage/methylation domain-containing protein/prepilin-type processing-associated H-X9-DG protein